MCEYNACSHKEKCFLKEGIEPSQAIHSTTAMHIHESTRTIVISSDKEDLTSFIKSCIDEESQS